jgi:LysR family transcriptional regulator, nitrogen assimilation regulatory protein
MEIRRLEYFVCIAEQGSLGRASDLLRIAQPALTRQVRLLEQELGVILFTRSRRGMRLTEEGEQLLSEVMGPLRQLEGALQNIRSFSSGISGNVAIGVPPTVAYFLAQPLLERIAVDEPNLAVRIVEGTSMHLNDWLVSGELDIAVLYGPSRDDKLRTCELVTEQMVLVGSAQSGLSPDRAISLKELITLPLILPNPRNGLRAVSERFAAKYKTYFKIKHVIDSFPITKTMVEDGQGYTNTRTLVLAKKVHPRSHRIMAAMDKIVQDVIAELFDDRKIFGELKIARPVPPKKRPILQAV